MTASLAVAAAWYGVTVVRAVREPLNEGAEASWIGVWLSFVALLLLSRAVLGRTRGVVPWAIVLSGVCLSMAVLSGQWGAVLLAIWLLSLAASLGEWLLQRVHATPFGAGLERGCVATALGLPLLALAGLLLALTGVLTAWAVSAVLVLLTLCGVPALRRALRGMRGNFRARERGEAPPERGVLLVTLGFVASLNFAWALAPEIQYDALNYQLAVPAAWVAAHRLVDLPLFWHSYFAHLVNMIFAIALALHVPAAAKLLIFATGAVAAGATYALGRAVFSERVGLWAAALFYTTPLVGWLAGTAYVDLPVAVFLTASLLALLRWKVSLEAGWLRASGLAAGAALGTKLPATYGVLALTVTTAVILMRRTDAPIGKKASLLSQYLLGLAVFAVPWFAIVYLQTGNPFFPMFNAIFRSPAWPPTNTTLEMSAHGVGTDAGSLLTIPLALTFETRRFAEVLPSGSVGLALALLPIAAILGWRNLRGKRLLLWIVVAYLLFWALNTQYARYYVPLLPLVCVIAVGAFASGSAPGGLRRLDLALLAVVVVLQVCLSFVLYWNLPERIPLRFAFGGEGREVFLARVLPGYEAVRYLNRISRPGEKVVGAGADSLRFYLKPPLASLEESRELQSLSVPPVAARVARSLAERGYAYLLAHNTTPSDERTRPYLTPEFLARYAALEYEHGNARVYRLSRSDELPPPARDGNLLDNPGLETLDISGRPTTWVPYGNPSLVRGPNEAHGGTVAVLATSTDGLTQPVRVRGGVRYVLRHWTRAAQDPGGSARLQVNWQDEWGTMLEATIDVVPASPQWTSHETVMTAPPRAAIGVVYASVHEKSRVFFDDLFFGERRSSAGPAR